MAKWRIFKVFIEKGITEIWWRSAQSNRAVVWQCCYNLEIICFSCFSFNKMTYLEIKQQKFIHYVSHSIQLSRIKTFYFIFVINKKKLIKTQSNINVRNSKVLDRPQRVAFTIRLNKKSLRKTLNQAAN